MKSRNEKKEYDAIVIGSGPNGLAAAITLQRAGLYVLLIEGTEKLGGGVRSAENTLQGFIHDTCAAVFPLAACSIFFNSLPEDRRPEFIYPEYAVAHPFDDGPAIVLEKSVQKTADRLSNDSNAYKKLFDPLLSQWPNIVSDLLVRLWQPHHLLDLSKFGMHAILPATMLAKRFKSEHTRTFFSGIATHSMMPVNKALTSSFALMLMLAAHTKGWPIIKGGSGNITNILSSYFVSLGGKIETNFYVTSLAQLPSSGAILFDVTPFQLLQIAGDRFSSFYNWQLKRYKYGPGIYKMDWALSQPAPFKASECRSAGTVHLGGSVKEILENEQVIRRGKKPDKPFVIFAQPSVFDDSRAPAGKHTAWAYCHSPSASRDSMAEIIEKQIERFAPGFRSCILARHSMNAEELENYNPNYIGGDINGGAQDLTQFFTRPALRFSPYRTSERGIYICSSSTPPGGGVHGICGMKAAKRVLKDVFNIVSDT